METKKCFQCNKIKPIEMFYKHKEMLDGHLGKCKECSKKYARKYFTQNRERIREYDKIRERSPDRKQKKLEYQRKMRKKFPGKYKARQKIGNAIHRGKIKKMPCAVCGDKNAQAHHSDYRKWNKIEWLCFKHHRETHGQISPY